MYLCYLFLFHLKKNQVSGVIAIGTTRSLVFVYDYSQNLKCILGDSARGML